MRRGVLAVAVCLALLATTGAFADKAPLPTGPEAAKALVPGMDVRAGTAQRLVDEHGFEASEGFSPGFLLGQQGWTVFSASVVEPQVSTANPHSGMQHLRVSLDAANPTSVFIGGFSPDLGPQDVTLPSEFSCTFSATGTGGADYHIVPQAPSQGFLTAHMNFDWLGNIQILDDALTWQVVGAWTANTVYDILITVDPVAGEVVYNVNGSPLWTGGIVAGTQIKQAVLFHDNWNAGDVGDFDSVVINTDTTQVVNPVEIPTQSTLGLFLLALLVVGAGLFVIRRR